jgi:hypothetical protein
MELFRSNGDVSALTDTADERDLPLRQLLESETRIERKILGKQIRDKPNDMLILARSFPLQRDVGMLNVCGSFKVPHFSLKMVSIGMQKCTKNRNEKCTRL